MRDYSKVFKEFWIGETGRYIKSCGHEVRTLATYLITCPHANVLGLYYLPLPLLCHEAGLSEEGASKGLRSLSEVGFARYDVPSETVWVVNMARFQLGETLDPKDNNVKWLPTALASLPKGPFLQLFYERYQEAYHLPPLKGLGRGFEGPSKPHRSIEREILDSNSYSNKEREDDSAPEAMAPLALIPEEVMAKTGPRVITVRELFDGWNDIAASEGLPKKLKLNDGLRKKIALRLQTYPRYAFWEAVINWIANNRRYHGANKSHWKCTLNWLVENDENPLSVYEEIPHGTEQRLEALGA